MRCVFVKKLNREGENYNPQSTIDADGTSIRKPPPQQQQQSDIEEQRSILI